MSTIISVRGAANLRKYKYDGVDQSLSYRYFLSPLADRCVDLFVPPWLTPNAITLLGFVSVAVRAICLSTASISPHSTRTKAPILLCYVLLARNSGPEEEFSSPISSSLSGFLSFLTDG